MSTPDPDELLARVDALLDGIDRHEDDPRGGWWQTPDGARIGCIKLRELKELINRAAALLRQPANGWQPISTAPKDGTEILTSNYDSIELTSWNLRLDWINRDCQTVFPAWWHPLPVQPEPPQGGEAQR